MVQLIMFSWYLVTGVIVPLEKVRGKQAYTLYIENGKVIEYAYKQEILEYLKTNTFEYDETLNP